MDYQGHKLPPDETSRNSVQPVKDMMSIRKRLIGLVAMIQSVLFLAHLLLYETWTFSIAGSDTVGAFCMKLILGFLSVTFVTASLLAFRYINAAVRAFYRAAAVWLGLLTYLFPAAVSSWTVFGVARLVGLDVNFHRIVEFLFGAAVLTTVYGVYNASWTRITRTTVRLANLPTAWRGRKAALISDVHLGHVRTGSFLRRIVGKIVKEQPDAIFIAGDLYDGTAIDVRRAAEPLKDLAAPQGVYFVTGNHEQFGDDSKYLHEIAAAGVRVLTNEKVEVDGLQIIGVPYRNASEAERLASALHGIRVDRERASILLTHAPDHPEIAEEAGVSLQLSGHTHLGQFIPWSWMARRIYRQFVYGLSRIGNMQVFTSSGTGTWGPPLRLGSNPEIVMLEFQ
jgi:predicted MPP superfamily phosphohydrolase